MKATLLVFALVALVMTGPSAQAPARRESGRAGGTSAGVRQFPAPVDPAWLETGRIGERERVSLDFDWRFAFGHAADPSRDFGFGTGEAWAKVTGWGGPVRSNFNDAAWRQRLEAILGAATRTAQVLAALLALAVLLVIGNTVRLDILGRAEEIDVMQLLGASAGFVRRPFLYAGLWYGAFSAALALLVVALVQWALAAPLQQLAVSYDHRFSGRGLGVAPALGTLAVGALLGWLGAWIATWRHMARAPR